MEDVELISNLGHYIIDRYDELEADQKIQAKPIFSMTLSSSALFYDDDLDYDNGNHKSTLRKRILDFRSDATFVRPEKYP